MNNGVSASAGVTRPARILALIVGLLAFSILIGLGSWQVRRLHWKEALLGTIAERIAAPPRQIEDLERQFKQTGDVDYSRVTVEGEFQHSGERHFFATWKGETGFYVYTPLKLGDGRFVLVNRGFVPYELKESAKRAQGQVEGRVAVTGLARNPLPEKPSYLVPDNDVAKNIFYWKDRDTMAASAGLSAGAVLPFFIDADDAPNPGGLPVGGVTMVDLPNSHLQYAVTWFGLAAALAAVLGVWLWRGRAPRSG
jgi:surfeit locus 1 family protein